MKHSIFFLLFFTLIGNSKAQTNWGSIRGSIQNSRQELLTGISIQIENAGKGAISNEDGFFEIKKIVAGNYNLVISSVGYRILKENVIVKPGEVTSVDLQLNETTKELEPVTVKAYTAKKYFSKTSTAGTRLPLSLIETPQTIQTITQQVIQDQQAQTLNDVTKNMTGVVANNQYTSYTMRGFLNSYYNQFITFDGYIGNMYQWTQLIPLYNIEKVEEIAGPASALFSTGSPGGVINMVTKKPLEKEAYSFNITTGSWNLIDVAADLGGPLSKDKKLLYRLNIGYNNQNSFRPSQFNSNLLIAPSLTYNFSNNTNVTLDYTYAQNNTRFGQDHGGLLLMNPDSTYNWKGVNNKFLFNSPKDFQSIANNNLTLRFNHQFNGNFQVSLMSRYIWSHQDGGEHYGDYYANNYFTAIPDSMQRAYDTWNYKPYNFQNSAFASFSFGKENFKQSVVAGIDYQIYGAGYNRYVNGKAPTVSFLNPDYSHDNFNYPIDANTYVWDVKQYNRQLGAYVQDLITINTKTKLLLSGRYDNYFFTNLPNSKDTYVTNDSSVAHVFLPRVGLVYSIDKNHSVYASYCQSFQPQYDNARNSGGPFPPQKGKQYELGYKGLYFDGKLLSTIALYSIKYVNVLATDPTDPTGLREIATPGLTSTGAEITLQGNINKQWSIIAGYAYNHVVFNDNSPLGPKGGRYDNSPNNIANCWIKYSLPQNSTLKGLNFSLGGKYVGNRVGAATNQHFLMPAYFVGDASVNYTIGRINIGLNGFNLTNNNYVLGYYASDFMVQVGTPINWRLSLRYSIK